MISLSDKAALTGGRSHGLGAATVEDVPGPILFLASGVATFIAGEVLYVSDGAISCK